MFTLEALQALHGDCLLLHWGSDDDPRLMLIDGGPNTVYRDTLRPRLIELARQRGNALTIDLLMLSHIDDDHINGIIDFAQELDDAGDRLIDGGGPPLTVKVRRLWHNSLEGLLDDPLTERATASVTASTQAALDLPDDAGEDAAEQRFHAMVLASVPQGQQLHAFATRRGWRLNPPFKNPPLVMRSGATKTATIEKLALEVIAPAAQEVEKLRVVWKEKRKKDGTLAAYKDRSPYNLSSIVALAEFDGKRMLLTGDARGDHVLAGLEAAGLLDEHGRIHVDLLKLPHHGSKNNVDAAFFTRVTADHYVISGDRVRFPNPSQDAMVWLRDARDGTDYRVYCTYDIPDLHDLFGDRLVVPAAGKRVVEAAL